MGLDFVEAASAPIQRDGALGFDVTQVAMAVAASSAAVAVKDYVVAVAETYATDRGADLLGSMLAKMRKRRSPGDKRPDAVEVELPPEQIAEIRRRAFTHARGLGLSDAKAGLLADAISGSLRTGT